MIPPTVLDLLRCTWIRSSTIIDCRGCSTNSPRALESLSKMFTFPETEGKETLKFTSFLVVLSLGGGEELGVDGRRLSELCRCSLMEQLQFSILRGGSPPESLAQYRLWHTKNYTRTVDQYSILGWCHGCERGSEIEFVLLADSEAGWSAVMFKNVV